VRPREGPPKKLRSLDTLSVLSACDNDVNLPSRM